MGVGDGAGESVDLLSRGEGVTRRAPRGTSIFISRQGFGGDVAGEAIVSEFQQGGVARLGMDQRPPGYAGLRGSICILDGVNAHLRVQIELRPKGVAHAGNRSGVGGLNAGRCLTAYLKKCTLKKG